MSNEWWKKEIAYQIYPKSFKDSNGDGIGDLRGIIEKLDYLEDLGVTLLWLCPIYKSPMDDNGYDISDYYDINPEFGTMSDLEELIEKAKNKGIKIIMDLVINHSSDEHAWFQEALKDPNSPYHDYYIFKSSKDGKEPNNWRSVFGGSVWQKVEGRDEYYFHAFSKKQPDLNWENPALRQELYKMINWWLDKGLGGFRIDAIINIKKKLPYKDYTVDRDDNLSCIDQMLADAKGVGEFLGEMRDKTFKPHNAFTVGEVFNEKDEELPDFIGDNGYFSSMFDFAGTSFGKSDKGWYANTRITPDDYKKCCFHSQKRIGSIGFLSNIIENHDEPRGVSYYIPEGECSDQSKKMLATLYFMLRGLPFIYQGQEIGMENLGVIPFEKVDDVSALDQYHVAIEAGYSEEEALKIISLYNRDNARTPVQWNAGTNAGFTTGTPWLMVNPNYTQINVESQLHDDYSVLSYYKKLIALRKEPAYQETIVYGDVIPYLEDTHNLMAYYRKGDKTLLVIGNYQTQEQTIALPAPYKSVLLNNYNDVVLNGNEVTLHGYQALILEL